MNYYFDNLREEVLATEQILEDIFEAIDNGHLYVEELPEGYEWDGGELIDPQGDVVEYPDEELPRSSGMIHHPTSKKCHWM